MKKITDLACGDARIAIQTLRNSAYVAGKVSRARITKEDVEEGYEEVRNIKRKYFLEGLGELHKLIYEIIKKSPRITSNDLIIPSNLAPNFSFDM